MRKRILWTSILITFISLFVFSFFITGNFYQNYLENSKESLKVYMNFYDESTVALNQAEAESLSATLGGARVTFLSLQGEVIADSAAQENDIEINHTQREEVISAMNKGEGFAVRKSKTLDKNMVYYCKKFNNALVRIAVFTASPFQILKQELPSIFGLLIADMVACFILTYITTKFILKPISQLAAQAQTGKKISNRYEELKPIVDVINARNEKIQADFFKIEKEKELALQAKASKDEMVANVTHEMNTPLTSIKGFSELLTVEGLSEEQRKRAVEIIQSQSERLSNLIAQIIHYSEMDNDELPSYDVDFSALIQDELKVFEPHLKEKNITLQTDIAAGVIVFSRRERLMAIFNNLLTNAIRYNKPGGKILVKLFYDGNFATFSVSDTGVGIAKEDLDKVFSRFFTVDKSHNGQGGGFGLGLAVVKKLCKKAGWTIKAESVPGEGTTFKVIF